MPAGRIRVLVSHHFNRSAVRARRDPTLERCFIGIGAAELTDTPLVSKRNVETMFQPPQTRGSRDGHVRVSRCSASQTTRRQRFATCGSGELQFQRRPRVRRSSQNNSGCMPVGGHAPAPQMAVSSSRSLACFRIAISTFSKRVSASATA